MERERLSLDSKQIKWKYFNMRAVIIQARMASSRFPGKVLREIEENPMLLYMLKRVSAAKNIDKVILATSTEASDEPIASLCDKLGITCYKGSHEDVLDRYYKSAKKHNVDTIVRLTADCPLVDPHLIDNMVETYQKEAYDYIGNTMPPKWTFPVGMDVEVFSFEALELAWRNEKDLEEREHVTFHFWKNPQTFSVFRYDLKEDLSRYRLTVDYPEDFEVVKSILTALYHKNPLFSMYDVINFLNKNPNIYKMNANVKDGWRKAYKI